MPEKPQIVKVRQIAKTRVFTVEQLDLQFSNGEQRNYERLQPSCGFGSVMVVPILDNDTMLLVKEYSAGVEERTLGFPKGGIDKGEDPMTAANRELMEEIGYKANNLQLLSTMALSPSYMSHNMQIYIGTDLTAKTLVGDEPEPLELVEWKFSAMDELLERSDFMEARSIAALFLAARWLGKN